MSGILLGVIGFAVVQHVKAKRRAQAAVAFEAAQSELGLDETFEQVNLPQSPPSSFARLLANIHGLRDGWHGRVPASESQATGTSCSCL